MIARIPDPMTLDSQAYNKDSTLLKPVEKVSTMSSILHHMNEDNDDSYGFMHEVSHIKLDDNYVVVYKTNINPNLYHGKSLNGSITMNQEVLRIPKYEVINLIKNLMSE